MKAMYDGPTEVRGSCTAGCGPCGDKQSHDLHGAGVQVRAACTCDANTGCATTGNVCTSAKMARSNKLMTRILCFLGLAKAPKAEPSKAQVMAYQFDHLIYRMVDKYEWQEADAREAFDDMKRYLWLCAATGKPLVPSKKIDEIWHNFILFTMDYAEFCQVHFGSFLHHRPRRRDDAPDGHSSPVGMTLKVATQHFGKLSKNWEFPGVKVEAGCSCSNWCQCS